MPALMAPALMLIRPGPGPANAPRMDIADIPRIPRRAIDRGTRHV
jgi:hypothetical protein